MERRGSEAGEADHPKDGRAPALLIEPWDLREKVGETKTGSLILFVVDGSGSMGAQRRMVRSRALCCPSCWMPTRGETGGLIAFRGTTAKLLLPPTSSVDLAQTLLWDMPTGGRTPLSRGLLLAMKVVETERTKDRNVLPLLVDMSDGRANVAMGSVDTQSASPGEGSRLAMNEAKAMATTIKEQRIPSVVIDTEPNFCA